MALESRGDRRNLICFVELWNQVGEVTPRAWLAQARAFVDLCLMDRAWIRLKDLTEGSEPKLEVLELAARLFIERGWPNHARKYLEKALAQSSGNPAIQALWDAAAAPPREPITALEESSDRAELLSLARTYLSTGALLKGQALLERIKREAPEHPLVDDLLWAIEGDFTIEGATLADLAERFGPDLSELAELSDDPDHTESITREEPMPGSEAMDANDARSFPDLFRTNDHTVTDIYDLPPELTTSMSMADLGELRGSVEAARTAAGIVSGEQDTQIRRVIRRDGGQSEVTDAGDQVHVQTLPTDPDFDLFKFRKEMGMATPTPPPAMPKSDLDDELEEEDDELIILTRREHYDEESFPLLEPETTEDTMAHPDAKRFLEEAARYRAEEEARRQAQVEDDKTTEPPKPKVKKRRRRIRAAPYKVLASSTPWWLFVIGVLLFVAAVFLTVFLLANVLLA